MRIASTKLWMLLLVPAMCPADSWAQARTRYRWQDPSLRSLSIIGGSFGQESYGLGGLTSSAAAPGGSILWSNLSRNPNFNLRRSSVAPAVPSVGARAFSSPTGQQYGTPSIKLRDLANVLGPSAPSAGAEAIPPGGLDAYLQAMGRGSELSTEDNEPVRSFVPSEPSLYQNQMEEGDRRFRQGEYVDAVGSFNIAAGLARHFPEVSLSLVHANFALGRFHTAAFHLRETLSYFPELPLVRIDIRDFYGKARAEDFDKHREALEKSLADASGDLWLLMAYLRYFDGQEEEAVAALREAFQRSQRGKDKALEEAVRMYWKGLSAAGKVSGPVDGSAEPTTLPAETADQTPAAPPGKPQEGTDKTQAADAKGRPAP